MPAEAGRCARAAFRAKGLPVEFAHPLDSPVPQGFVLFAIQAKVGIMVQEVAEYRLAVVRVLPRVKDVLVPEPVDV
jgi:hypothetical protein